MCGISVAAWADSIPLHLDHNNVRVTYETLTLPGDEAMGLVGLNYQQMFGSYWYGGLGVYGAASGERGGFFTGGFEGGLRYPLLSDFEAEMGLFIGGGGGGAAPQGGGLMIRPHIGLTYGNSDIRAGLQLSRIEFPNGEIKSSQIAAVVDLPFESFRLDGGYRGRLNALSYDAQEMFQRSLAPVQGTFGIEMQHYIPSSGSRKTDGSLMSEAFDTVGIRYENFVSRNVVWHLTTAGALSGGVDGYAEIFSGMGWRYGLFERTSGKSRLTVNMDGAIGLGGGGQIATGGGTMGKVTAGVSYRINPQWSADIKGGYVRSFDGDFSGELMSLSINHPFVTIKPSVENFEDQRFDYEFVRSDWQIRPVHETYLSAQRKNGDKAGVSLVGMQMDALTGGFGYFYGKALGAYSGGAGGYVSGTLGVGVNYRLPLSMSLYTQAGIGAGGGGGIDAGSGAIVEAEAGVRYEATDNTNLWIGAGLTKSITGELETPTLKGGVMYRFSTVVK
ncbi:MAG: hypothetical protein ACXWB0_04860 [Sulfuricurvum sp.]